MVVDDDDDDDEDGNNVIRHHCKGGRRDEWAFEYGHICKYTYIAQVQPQHHPLISAKSYLYWSMFLTWSSQYNNNFRN